MLHQGVFLFVFLPNTYTRHRHTLSDNEMLSRHQFEELNHLSTTGTTIKFTTPHTLVYVCLCICMFAWVCVLEWEACGEQSEQLNSCYGDNELDKSAIDWKSAERKQTEVGKTSTWFNELKSVWHGCNRKSTTLWKVIITESREMPKKLRYALWKLR